MHSADLSALDARRIAIAAQGFAAPRPRTVNAAALRAMLEQLGVIQIDSVNVLARSQYLIPWSRLGGYDPGLLDAMSHEAPRSVFEYWGHEASLLPVSLQPLFRWRMARAREDAWRRVREMARRRSFVARVLDAVTERGPIGAGELGIEARPKTSRGWWEWSEVKVAIEWLFWSGQVTSARRRVFERLYDLPARVLP
ncbi:MAG: DNA glycosylase AlkZ-like family protein, partial [Kofleriaceae bacterium]